MNIFENFQKSENSDSAILITSYVSAAAKMFLLIEHMFVLDHNIKDSLKAFNDFKNKQKVYLVMVF